MQDKEQTIVEHLNELRKRLLYIVIVVAAIQVTRVTNWQEFDVVFSGGISDGRVTEDDEDTQQDATVSIGRQWQIKRILDRVEDGSEDDRETVVKEGETGYYPTNWQWGKDLKIAKKCADDYNKNLGLTDKEVQEIIIQSMIDEPKMEE